MGGRTKSGVQAITNVARLRGHTVTAAWWAWLAVLVALASSPPPLHAMADAVPRPEVPKWHLGEGLGALDSFTYGICVANEIPTLGSRCITARLEFIGVLDEWHGPVWVAQATFGVPGEGKMPWQDAILRIGADGRLGVSADAHHGVMVSVLQDTLLWLDAHAGRAEPRGLGVGDAWGAGDAALHVLSVDLAELGGDSVEVASVGYPGSAHTRITILDGFPFPLEATVHKKIGPSERTLFELELLDHSVAADASAPEPETDGYASETERLVIMDPAGAADVISVVCGSADDTHESVAELCVSATGMASDAIPWVDVDDTEPTEPHADVTCSGSLLPDTCYAGIVTSAEGSVIGINGEQVRLSLVRMASGLDGLDVIDYVLSECAPGSWASVDIDDAMPIDAEARRLGTVYCGADTPLNALVIAAGHAELDVSQCATSEFSKHEWAASGCG